VRICYMALADTVLWWSMNTSAGITTRHVLQPHTPVHELSIRLCRLYGRGCRQPLLQLKRISALDRDGSKLHCGPSQRCADLSIGRGPRAHPDCGLGIGSGGSCNSERCAH